MKQNMFGTDGIRGVVGTFPFTPSDLFLVGRAIGRWIGERPERPPVVALAHDTRASAHFAKTALSAGLMLEGVHVHDLGMLPTPVASFFIKYHARVGCGVVITASHNPYQYNGIKIVDQCGNKISLEDELSLSARIQQMGSCAPTYDSFGSYHCVYDAAASYCSYVENRFGTTFLADKLIVLDCAHGATSVLAPHVFRVCGAQVVTINNEPDGTNINTQCGALHPESLQRAVCAYQADAGFAFDGDGDRLVAIRRDGKIRDGDDILTLIARHPKYAPVPTLVGTVMSNQGLARYAQEQHKKLVRTPVGEKEVVSYMLAHEVPIGAEPSGHVVIRDHLESGDGIFAALVLMESLACNGMPDMESFVHYPQVLINLPVAHKKDLAGQPCAALIEAEERSLNGGRMVVRYSGTEDLLRILVEAPDEQVARACAQRLAEQFSRLCSQP